MRRENDKFLEDSIKAKICESIVYCNGLQINTNKYDPKK